MPVALLLVLHLVASDSAGLAEEEASNRRVATYVSEQTSLPPRHA